MNTSETIREWIRGLFEANHDFSNREDTKKKFIEHFEDPANKLGISWNKHSTLFIEQLKKVCKEKNIDPALYGYSSPKKSFKIQSGNIESKITPKPKTQTESELKPKTSSESTEEKKIVNPLSDEESKGLTKIAIGAGIGVFQKVFKDADKFTDEEKDTLTLVWNPCLKGIWERVEAKWILAAATTFALCATKIKRKDEKQQQESTDTISDADKKDFAQWKKEQENKK